MHYATPATEPPEAPGALRWTYRTDIDGVRGIAILLVILFHAQVPFIAGGFAGVDVFFVLSGFLIAGILFEEVRRRRTISLVQFWARRSRRLLPAATVASLGTLLLVACLASPSAVVDYAKTAIAFALYASNLLFVRRQADYFATKTIPDPLLHTWTLAVEEQFYLVFAPLLLFIALRSARAPFAVFLRRSMAAISIVAGCSFIANITLGRHFPLDAFYTLPFRAWEFGLGAICAAALARGESAGIPGSRGVWAVNLGVLGLVLTAFVVPERASSSGFALLLPTLSTVAIVLGGVKNPGSRILNHGGLRAIGKVSYSWYLWHWPALMALAFFIERPALEQRLAVSVLALGVAAVSYHFVEQPVRESKWLRERPGLSLGLAVGAAAVIVLAAIGVELRAERQLRSPEYREINEAQTTPLIADTRCHLIVEEIVPGSCVFGDTASATTIVLFGDSHAEHWFTPIATAARTRHWRLVSLTKSGCPAVDIAVMRPGATEYPECAKWRALALDRIRGIRPTLVMIGSGHQYSVHLASGELASLRESAAAQNAWQEGLKRTLDEVAATGAASLIIGDVPTPTFDVPICLSTPARTLPSCGFMLSPARRDSISSLEAPVVSSVRRAAYLETIGFVCETEFCPAIRNKRIVWKDDNHLSAPFSSTLTDVIASAIERSLAGR